MLLRIYPYLVYVVPYSTDSWTPIRNSEELLAHTPTTLGGNPSFDGYNIYWPANSLFGAVASLVFNSPPIQVMPLLFPVLGAVTMALFFLVAEEISGSAVVASIASLFLASAGVDAIFTAGVTKEAYALPLFMVSVLLLLWKTDLRSGALFAITSVTLALSHHATAALFLVVAGSIIFVNSVLLNRRGELVGKKPLLLVIGGATTTAYFLVYADAGLAGFGSLVTVQNLLMVLAFLTVFIAPVAYHTVTRPSRLLLAESGAVLATAAGVLAIGTWARLIPLAPVVSSTLLYASVPYVLLGALAVFGYRTVHAAKDRRNFAFVASWIAAVLAVGFFALFSGTAEALSLVYRMLTFIGAPAIILASLALQRVLGGTRRRGLARVLVVGLIVTIAVPSAYQTYATSIQRDNLLGGQWAYQPSDLSGARWISADSGPWNLTLAADSRMQYLLTGYLGMRVDNESGYLYLRSPEQTARPAYLVTYSLMESNGYVASLYGLRLADNWTAALQRSAPVLYNNGNMVLW